MLTTPTIGTMRALLHRGGAALLRGVLPASCALCAAGGDELLCPDCAAQFFGVAAVRCPRCANPLPDSARGQLCGACRAEPPAFDVTLVAADYAMPLDQLVLQLKFGHRLALATLFARLLRDAVLQQPGFTLPALLCPVPLGPRRLAERGYNQALEIARPLARSLGVALHPRLAWRVQETAAQSSVTPERRRHNIAGAFAIPDMALVQGRHIGVVDDVMTSGATLNELAATLKRHGAAQVSNLVFARTPPH
ncbi:ComF family protein [Rugamonas sp. FT107W]|uniref:ComF family protein n=1 Tax=Duganella vulcania TaxID=2692166 RepID=A0A845H9B2_9BURK|nr:ComF family protein [Duganella vulcania]MYN15331.1 ComF family protein [Duganella vulcania]